MHGLGKRSESKHSGSGSMELCSATNVFELGKTFELLNNLVEARSYRSRMGVIDSHAILSSNTSSN